MARFKDLADPALVAELRRRAEAAAVVAAAAAAAEVGAAVAAADKAAFAEPDDAAAPGSLVAPSAERTSEIQNAPGFASLIGAVMPLATPPRHCTRGYRPPPHPRQREADEANALDASRAATSPGPMAWDVGLDIEGAQSFVRTGLNPDLLRKLRRGHWVVQGALDLHRHTQEEARVALGDFMARARRHGWRCVRIIHGKGLSSPNREPVLKGKVRKWLQQRDEVLAYCEPRPHAGGSGAVVVLLAGAGRP
jgi:DNA-nicking Smr family endonuclease